MAFVFVAIVAAMSAYGMKQNDAPAVPADSVVSASDSIDSMDGGMSLNDIRFDGWTSSDWLDNDYIRALRSYLDDYAAGGDDAPDLAPYKELLKGKFLIANIEPALMGGAFIQFTFLDMPDRIFDGWVYSFVDEETGTVAGYEVRLVRIKEESTGLTREYLLDAMKKMPELKLW